MIAVPAGPLGSFPPQDAAARRRRLGRLLERRPAHRRDRHRRLHGRRPRVGVRPPFEAAGARSLLLQDAYVFKVVNDPNAVAHRRLVQARRRRPRRRHADQRRVLGDRRAVGALPRTTLRAPAPTRTPGPSSRWTAPSPTRPTSTPDRVHAARRGRPARRGGGRRRRHAQLARPPHRPHVPADQVPRAPEGPGAVLQPLPVVGDPRARCSARSATRSRSARRSTRSTRSA